MHKRVRTADKELSVTQLITDQLSCSHDEAVAVYHQIFRLPAVVSLGILYHRGGQHGGGLEPVVLDKHAYLLIPHINAHSCASSPSTSTSSSSSMQAVRELINELSDVLTNIDGLACSDDCKSRLKAMASTAAAPGEHQQHEHSLTDYIQQHLGYLPGNYKHLMAAVDADRADIPGAVARACKQLGVLPRQRLLIMRGETGKE